MKWSVILARVSDGLFFVVVVLQYTCAEAEGTDVSWQGDAYACVAGGQ